MRHTHEECQCGACGVDIFSAISDQDDPNHSTLGKFPIMRDLVLYQVSGN